MDKNEIRRKADECLDVFHLLLDLEKSLKPRAENLFHGDLHLDDQRARFEIWAGNIGVFADNHASLDHRLREAEEAKRLLVDFLQTLCIFLQRAKKSTELVQSSLSSSLGIDIDKDCDYSASSAISSSFRGTETESLDVALVLSLTPFEQRLQGIENCIDRLYRLSLQIRRPSIAFQNAKAERHVILDDEGNNIDETFTNYAHSVVEHQFRQCDPKIRQRLAEGIVTRRKRFLYRQRHQLKLNTRTVFAVRDRGNKPTTSSTFDQSTIKGSRIVVRSANQNETPKGLNFKRTPSETTASEMVMSPVEMKKVLDDGSKISIPSTNVSATHSPVAIPDPPTPMQGSKEFECPYCCILIPISYAKASSWRQHVMQDLEPYCCVFPECAEPKTLYANRNTWIEHLQAVHTMRWVCNSSGHAPCSFDTPGEYDDHMRSTHAGSFSEAQLHILRKGSKAARPVTFDACPLCGYVPSDEELRNMPQSKDIDGNPRNLEKAKSDRITKHVADHLVAIAVKALPWQDVSMVQGGHEGSQQAEDGVPVGLSSIEKLPSTRRAEVTASDEGGTPFTIDDRNDHYDPEVNGCYDDVWAFWPRQEYYGHDRDPVLQSLLQKLYIDKLLDAQSPREVSLPAYVVPFDRDVNFFARENVLKAIEDTLCPDDTSDDVDDAAKPSSFPRCFAIHAPGGMGKTQVAAQFTVIHRDDFDAVLWVHAENASKIEQDFKNIAIALGLVAKSSPNATNLAYTRDALKRWLVNPVKSKAGRESGKMELATWLLVFDGVEDGEVLNKYWPYNGPGSILITSRNPYSWASSLELKPFTLNQATDYLLHITGTKVSDTERSAVTTIAKLLGCLPLALVQMGGIIVHEKISFTKFLDTYKQNTGRQELLRWAFDVGKPRHSNYQYDGFSIWADDSLDEGSTLLNILSMLDPDNIPEQLFWRVENDEDDSELSAIKLDYKVARNELLSRSLVTGNKGNKKLFIHRLVQDVCRTRMEPIKFREVFLLTTELLIKKWPFEKFTWRHSIARWQECEELLPHVEKLKEIFEEMAQAIDSFEDYKFAKLLVDAAWYCHERGNFQQAIAFNNKAQTICESLKLKVLEHPEYAEDAAEMLSQLNYSLAEISRTRGCVAAEINDPLNALKYHKDFNASMIKELAGEDLHNDMRLALSWNDIGVAYMLNRKWSEGEKSFAESIKEMKRMMSFRPTMVSLPVANYGLSYWAQGKHEQALEVLLEGLKDRVATFGEDDKESFITGRLLHAIGNVKCSQGALEEGKDYHRRALLHYKSTLGGGHHRTADLFVKLAYHSIRTEQYEMALILIEHGMEAYSDSQYFLPERLRASFKRVQALRGLQRIEEANAECSKCFVTYCKLFKDTAAGLKIDLGLCKTSEKDLVDRDIDQLVAFWSR